MAGKKKILFVVNPISGVKKKISIEDLIKCYLDLNQFEPTVYYTTAKGDATKQSKEATAIGHKIVVAVGGDGTINEVAQGVINTSVALAVIPRGSGNGFANYFQIPHDPVQAIKLINQGHVKTVDTGTLNGNLFLNVAGLGFDARVSTAFDVFGRRGLLSYMYISLREYFKYRPRKYSIQFNGSTIETKAFLITAANSSQFGNNAYIAPNAIINDGLLDLVILKPTGAFNLALISLRLFNGSLHKSKYCEIHRVKEVTISHNDTEAQIDGEPLTVGGTTTIGIKPNSLNVIS